MALLPTLFYSPNTRLEFARICTRLRSKHLTDISLFNAVTVLGGRTRCQAMWWMRDWCPPASPHLFSSCCIPLMHFPRQPQGHGRPIFLVRATQHIPRRKCALPFQGAPLSPCLPGSGLAGRCGLGLPKTGQHGREVQNEQLHLGVPSTARVPSQSPRVPSPPSTPGCCSAGFRGGDPY